MLGVEDEPPELDERTAFWVRSFNLLCRTRPPSMGGIPCLSPTLILDMSDRLHWPCDPDECVEVICAMDDEFRDIHKSEPQ